MEAKYDPIKFACFDPGLWICHSPNRGVTMWPFKRKESLDDRINRAIISSGLKSADLTEEFGRMNDQILAAFAKSNDATNLNSKSLIVLADSLASVIKKVNELDDRLAELESQLSITKVTFVKGGD